MAPLLLFLFTAKGLEPAAATLNALATSMAAILFTGSSSLFTHALHKSVNWRYACWLVPAAMLGAAASANLASIVPSLYVILLMATYLAFTGWKIFRSQGVARDAPGVKVIAPTVLAGAGFLGGILGPITGTGGGLAVSSTLSILRQPLIFAIGTSAAVTAGTALAGTLAFATGPSEVNFTILFSMAPACMLCAAIGARLANKLPLRWLQISFATLMALITLRLIWLAITLVTT